jgi:diamine N-acetyltransferase
MEFIDAAQKMEVNVHMAIVDEFDTYMGTVSLKHIEDHTAEFAIVMRMGAMGKGYSTYAIREMIKKGFEEIALERIYWCVDKANVRARRFYNKNGYTQIDWKYSELQKIVCKTYTIEEIESYIWYMVKNNEV